MRIVKISSIFIIAATLIILFSGCQQPNYQLSTSTIPNNGGKINPSGGRFPGGNKVTLIASPAQYYQFTGWAGDASGNTNPLTIAMNSNKQIIAQFSKITYPVQVKSNPANGGTVRPDSGTFEAGNNLTINATPASGYRFVNWGIDASGTNNPLNILVNKSLIITANFVRQYKLSVSANPTSGTISPAGGIYDAGTQVNITATPEFPYAFKNWIGVGNNDINPSVITMNADKSISVNFVKLAPIKTVAPQPRIHIANGTGTSVIDLKQFEWAEGTVDCGDFPQVHAYIQGPDGKTVKDFGSIGIANFRILASIPGKYSVIVTSNAVYGANYNISYTVYGLQ